MLDKSVDCDVNKNNNIFEKHILIVKNKTMSSKTVKFNKKKHKGNDWMTDNLLDLINLKNRLYKEFKQTPTRHVEYNSRKTNLQTCQRIYKRNKDSVKRDYYYKLFHKYKSDIKNTWVVLSNVLNKRQNNQEVISLKINDTIIQDYQAIADKFNDYFASIAQHTVDSLICVMAAVRRIIKIFLMKQLKQILILKKLLKRQYWVY